MTDEPTLAELQAEAEARGLPKYGTKAEIAERIATYDEDQAARYEAGVISQTEIEAAEAKDLTDDEAEADEAEADEYAEEPDEPTDDADDEPEPAPESESEPVRAGGYVDRGDGEGWVLDDSPQHVPPPDPRSTPVDPGVLEDEAPQAGGRAGGWVLE